MPEKLDHDMKAYLGVAYLGEFILIMEQHRGNGYRILWTSRPTIEKHNRSRGGSGYEGTYCCPKNWICV